MATPSSSSALCHSIAPWTSPGLSQNFSEGSQPSLLMEMHFPMARPVSCIAYTCYPAMSLTLVLSCS